MEVNVHEAKTHLSRLLERIANGKEVAETMPKRRELGWSRDLRENAELALSVASASSRISRPADPDVERHVAADSLPACSSGRGAVGRPQRPV
jgi:antitoxin (DNA-binding transcriptional repressor) of toxin-antitoxin stability system